MFSGLSPRQFGNLVEIVADRGGPVIADGRKCRPWSLTLADRVLLVAVYLRTNLTVRQIGPLFGVSKSAAGRIMDSLKPLLGLEHARPAATTGRVFIVDGTLVPTHDRGADSSKNYRRSSNIQVMIDADTRLTVAVAGPLPGSRHDSKAFTQSGINHAAGNATVIADGGYAGHPHVIIPYRKPNGGTITPWQRDLNTIHKRIRARIEHAIGSIENWNILRNCRLKGDGVLHATSAIAIAHMRDITLTHPP
ncbi:Transposase [Stackebrandtia soli]